VQHLYPILLEEFNHLRKSGVKFSSHLLRELALSIIVALKSIFTAHSVDPKASPKDDIFLVNKITTNWINQFMDNHNIVLHPNMVV